MESLKKCFGNSKTRRRNAVAIIRTTTEIENPSGDDSRKMKRENDIPCYGAVSERIGCIDDVEDYGEIKRQDDVSDGAVSERAENRENVEENGELVSEYVNGVVSSRDENRENAEEDFGERKRDDKAPDDDCCPICFGNFILPCKANCGHWYCASCILQFWNYSAACKPCKCPMCSRYIVKLTPEGSLQGQQEKELTELLKNVQRYNHLFTGGANGLIQKVRELPLFMKRMFWRMMDPDRPYSYYEVRLIAMTLTVLYEAFPFDFIPTGRFGIFSVFDCIAVALVIILRLVGDYRRRQLNQQEEMGPPNAVRTISQEAFDNLVKDNIEELEMDPTEALNDAIHTLTLQGVHLAGIVTCVPGEDSLRDNPVIACLDNLKELNSLSINPFGSEELDALVLLFDRLSEVCTSSIRGQGSGNAAIATKNGGIQLLCSLCAKIESGFAHILVSALKPLPFLIHDVQSTETFRVSGGPKIVVDILRDGKQNLDIINGCFAVVSAAATGNEVVKQSFMELKIDQLILQILSKHRNGSLHSLYDSIRILLTPDDSRVVASQVYGYARRFAKTGIAGALVDSLHAGLSSPSLVSATIALKAVAVNDEICKSIANSGGIDALLLCIDDSGEQGNGIVAITSCSLLSKLAGSDSNKTAIVEKGGMNRLIKLSARFFDNPFVLQEVMGVITVLSLRSPDNAARAIEAGAGDLAIEAMQKFPAAEQLQRNSCLMIRNLAVRNPEIRQGLQTLLLNNGVEMIIRKAKEKHQTCKAAATDALRDLGLDNYNT
ncbi:zf-C3HC4 domain-containing protein [Cephalotus follicularis]|uniref:Zf-C3HC4 domain-containing protein n=1 Tax=Cephalotus follicularis TaxID=3775 RepID=A0A1Q3B037_CEPFO|nr:zf-C3HC4 domain-containing protein [Cephalotus follicularis]